MDQESRLQRLRDELAQQLLRDHPASARLCETRGRVLIDQTSHAVRWAEPFMPTIRSARGAYVEDLDGHRLLDFWQGHFTNILGHNSPVICDVLSRALDGGHGLQSGMLHYTEAKVAEILCRQTGMDTLRFTTTGSLGTFYGVLLARGFTGRDRILKVAGGWHGSQPFGLKGVAEGADNYEHVESEGLPRQFDQSIVLTRFNDLEDLRRVFDRYGDQLACYILEPWLGAGGGIPATLEYLQEARRLTEKHGALLICDEIITGFRFRAGDVSSLYGVKPDLLVLGKVIGGGMPVAAVAGREDVMRLCTREVGRVKFEGGTFSAHELSLLSARTLLEHVIAHEEEVYGRLAERGETARVLLRAVFEEAGVPVCVTGQPNGPVEGSSMVSLHPGFDADAVEKDGTLVPSRGQLPWLNESLMKSLLLAEGVTTRHGLGSVCTEHSEQDLQQAAAAWARALERLRGAGLL